MKEELNIVENTSSNKNENTEFVICTNLFANVRGLGRFENS